MDSQLNYINDTIRQENQKYKKFSNEISLRKAREKEKHDRTIQDYQNQKQHLLNQQESIADETFSIEAIKKLNAEIKALLAESEKYITN